MAYFKIGNTDLSQYVSTLKITKKNNYIPQTNAAGNSVVDYINTKRSIEVKVISLDESDFRTVLAAITFNSVISYRDPMTGELSTANCIIDSNDIEYYTIQTNWVKYKEMRLVFKEL